MTTKQYILYRNNLRKTAYEIPVLGPLVKSFMGAAGKATGGLSREALAIAAMALPSLSIGSAYLLARAASPEAVAKNAPEYAINALEKESLAQSLRDLEDQKLAAELDKTKRKFHDRFV